MKQTKLIIAFSALAALTACGGPASNTNSTTANTANINIANAANTATPPNAKDITAVARPQKVVDLMKERGEQDEAKPTLKIIEPKADAAVSSSTVKVKLDLAGDLKGYKPMKDMTTGMGNHIHVILDNQPYEAYYNLGEEFELRNVSDGAHTLRVFPSRPWHESYKNDGAFQMVKFTVKNGGADANKPATTNANQVMSNSNSNAANSSTPPEGKDMPPSTGGDVDAKKPLLTYSRPKGEYKAADAENIMIDFWLLNAKLQGDGGEYRIRYSINGDEWRYLDKWEPIWLTGWANGKYTIKLDLLDKTGNVVDNGGYNSTTREIIVTK